MTSYQKLKNRIAELEADRLKLLTDEKYYLTCFMANEIRKDIERAYWFGGKSVGEINGFEGIWSKLTLSK